MVHLKRHPIPVSLEGTNIILEQMKNCICLIYNNYKVSGTGFFCTIPYKSQKIKAMITADYIINEEELRKSEVIQIKLNDKLKEININDGRKIYSSEQYKTTIIEINPYKDEINNFLELDENLFKEENEELYLDKSIYLLQCLDERITLKIGFNSRKEVSYGVIYKKLEENYIFAHLCSTDKSSGGSPILNINNNKVIGIHFGSQKGHNYNLGTFLKYPINDFNKDNNLINKLKEYNDKDFSNLKLISSGGYGDIYSAYSIKDETEICLKKINIEKMKLNYELNELKDYQKDLNNEIKILNLLSYNKNSVKYFGNYDKEKEKIIIMEKCDNNLYQFIKQRGKALIVEEIKKNLKVLMNYLK